MNGAFVSVSQMLCVQLYKAWFLRKEKKKESVTEKKGEKKKDLVSHAGNRTPATAVRAPDPNH